MSVVTGIWQCGNQLVVDTTQFAFPDHCAWTNDPVDANRSTVEFKAELPSEWRYSLLHGIRHRGEFRTFKIPMSVSSGWDESRHAGKKRIGKILFRTGFVLGLCGIGAIAWLYQYEGDRNAAEALVPGIIAVATIPFAIIGAVVGLAWPHLEGTPGAGGPVAAKLTEERFLWIEGAHPQFLESLPAWSGPALETSFAARGSFGDIIAKNWPYMLMALLFWMAIIAAKAFFKQAVLK